MRHAGEAESSSALQRPGSGHHLELYDLSPVGHVTLGPGGRIEAINRSGAQLLGWTPRWLAGKCLSKWVIAEDAGLFQAHLRAVGGSLNKSVSSLRIKNRYGRVLDIRLESVALGDSVREASRCLTVMLDMSEHQLLERRARTAQARLIQASRFNMMGELASSLAHELNQPLGAILLDSNACLNIIRESAVRTDSAKLETALSRICDSSAYAGAIIRRLRDFLRPGDGEREAVDLNCLVVEATRLVARDADDRDVTLRLELGEALPRACADAVQIEQVLLNLIRNSMDALETSRAGQRQITITTGLAEPNQLRISVSDTGPGVSAQLARHVFEPLFTTKSAGMGLGLSISRSIVEAHLGRIWLDASVMAGTTFHCSLPAATGTNSS